MNAQVFMRECEAWIGRASIATTRSHICLRAARGTLNARLLRPLAVAPRTAPTAARVHAMR